MFACMGSHIETMEYLFANGATEDVCRPDNHWMTCVHEAATNGNLDVLIHYIIGQCIQIIYNK